MKRLFLPVVVFCAVPAIAHETLTTTVLFDREIVRILDKHCVMCHVENGPAFPLATYEQTWLQKRRIHSATIARHMPPWAAVPGYGQFLNDNGLTLRETQFIVSWVEGLGPRNSGTVFLNVTGPSAARPAEVRAHADFGTWRLGQPQFTRLLPANTVEPHVDEVKRTVIDLGLTSERRLRGLEFEPGDHRVVRAAFFTIQGTGQWIGSWTPWFGYASLPKGSAYKLSAGTRVVAEIYYRGTNERVVEQGTLGLFFDDPPPSGAASSLATDLVLNAQGPLQPGAAPQKLRASMKLAADTSVLALRPEMTPGAKSVEVSARRPDGGTDVLLLLKDPGTDWPTPYLLKDSVTLPKGTELVVTAYFTNASSQPQTVGVRVTVSGVQKAGVR